MVCGGITHPYGGRIKRKQNKKQKNKKKNKNNLRFFYFKKIDFF
jgi:hypothetical protein